MPTLREIKLIVIGGKIDQLDYILNNLCKRELNKQGRLFLVNMKAQLMRQKNELTSTKVKL